MKYLDQLAVIFIITFMGEVLNRLLPFPMPASIYGFLIMLLALQFKIIKLEKIKDVGSFLLDIMSIMFIPSVVGLMVIWKDISGDFLKILIISIVSTLVVMVATGKVADFVLRKDDHNERNI